MLNLCAHRISCLAIISIWYHRCLFKLGGVFPAISPFIAVICGLITDILHFVVVHVVLFVPFLICLWIIFGSVNDSVQGSKELTAGIVLTHLWEQGSVVSACHLA